MSHAIYRLSERPFSGFVPFRLQFGSIQSGAARARLETSSYSSLGQTFEQLFAELLKWDQVFFAIPNLFWIILLFADLRAAGFVHAGWLKISFSALGLIITGGNGTMLGLMWLYREEALATRRDRGAVVPRPDLLANAV
ncbi:hypothetical protein N7530_007941 [Penicillium desertorum]|uniref:Uncharacterized protein n=1 Tax=Penicillium desertorum TaxID=1303715 RepID=A0A9W9WN73_9EURO|nr:hypothetical protein N7530_007941 [Penicillium desertorum]